MTLAPDPSCASALKPGSQELGCSPTGPSSWSCFFLRAQVCTCQVEGAGLGPCGSQVPFRAHAASRGMSDVGPRTDGMWKASHTLEVLCTFEKAEGVFPPPKDMTSTSNLFMP